MEQTETDKTLETIVISLAREIKESTKQRVDQDTYELIQAHIWDAFELGKQS